MLTFNRTEDLSEEIVKTLILELKTKIPSFVNVFNEWPAGNFTIKYPSASVLTVSNPEHRSSQNKPIVLIGAVVNFEAQVLRESAFWEWDLQLDVWCVSKNQRTQLLRELETVLDPNEISDRRSGLHLAMPEYYNEICSYTYLGYSYEDGEISSQRREWRAIVRVKADARALQDKLEKVMSTIQLDLETRNTDEELDPQP